MLVSEKHVGAAAWRYIYAEANRMNASTDLDSLIFFPRGLVVSSQRMGAIGWQGPWLQLTPLVQRIGPHSAAPPKKPDCGLTWKNDVSHQLRKYIQSYEQAFLGDKYEVSDLGCVPFLTRSPHRILATCEFRLSQNVHSLLWEEIQTSWPFRLPQTIHR